MIIKQISIVNTKVLKSKAKELNKPVSVLALAEGIYSVSFSMFCRRTSGVVTVTVRVLAV